MTLRVSYSLIAFSFVLMSLLLVLFLQKGESESAHYIGSQRCRSCHNTASSEKAFQIWESSRHAKAFTTLKSDKAKEFLAREDAEIATCLPCHTTLGREAIDDVELAINSEGVGCERCHGPGSGYANFPTMSDREAFRAVGGVVGSLRDCHGCHVPSPNETITACPFQEEEFDTATEWERIAHPSTRN